MPLPPSRSFAFNAVSPEGPEGISTNRGKGVSPTAGSWYRRCFHVARRCVVSSYCRLCIVHFASPRPPLVSPLCK